MDDLVKSCTTFYSWPKNVPRSRVNNYQQAELLESLNERDDSPYPLFDSEDNALVGFWETRSGTNDFHKYCIENLDEMKKQLSKAIGFGISEPVTRFIFIEAVHSRAPLRLTKHMLQFIFTYHQVSPFFLEHILPFGSQLYARDFHFIGLKQDNTLKENKQGLRIPELKRSGREFRLFYTLKSVEAAPHDKLWPWSIRQSAVYHSFDVESGQSIWIVVKGNDLIKKRVQDITNSHVSIASISDRLGATFQIHLLVCQWAIENWSRYIYHIEQAFQKETRKALHTSVAPRLTQRNTFSKSQADFIAPLSRRSTVRTLTEGLGFNRSRTSISMMEKSGQAITRQPVATNFETDMPESNYPTTKKQPPVQAGLKPRAEPPLAAPFINNVSEPAAKEHFEFGDLQYTQQLEEKAQEALLVLSLDKQLLVDLRRFYTDLAKSKHMPEELKTEALIDFDEEVSELERAFKAMISRFIALLRLIQDRKQLMFGILEYSTMEASKVLSEKAQDSADNMHLLTSKMHWIAQKTLDDTVAMKTITWVALFFLPGTFVSAIMSTDIVQFSKDDQGHIQKVASTEALWLYFAITVPMMLLTFLASLMYRSWEHNKQDWKELRETERIYSTVPLQTV